MGINCHLTLVISALMFLSVDSVTVPSIKGEPNRYGVSHMPLASSGLGQVHDTSGEHEIVFNGEPSRHAQGPGQKQLPTWTRLDQPLKKNYDGDDDTAAKDEHLDQTIVDHSYREASMVTKGHNKVSEEDKGGDMSMSYTDPYGDLSLCLNCICSRSRKRKIHAHCENKELLTIPLKLPHKIWSLNMAHNRLRWFNTSIVLQYPFLSMLSLASNFRIYRIMNSTKASPTSDIITLDLSSCNITRIDDNSFVILPRLKNLTFWNNKLQNLTKSMFAGLINLQTLSLGSNDIVYIERGSFDHLVNLQTLDLSRNKRLLYTQKHFPPWLFENMTQLQNLYIQGNSNGGPPYPDKTLQKIVNLNLLRIDGLGGGVEFGPEMRSLKNFRHLELGSEKGNCYIQKITDSFFKNTPFLESFSIAYCRLRHISPGAYNSLNNLTKLVISHMGNYELPKAFEELVGLQNTSLKNLSLIHLYHSGPPCRFLGREQAKYLKNIGLEKLDLSENLLALIGSDFLQELPRSLKWIILNRNKFTFKGLILWRMQFLSELTELDMSEQNEDNKYELVPGPYKTGCALLNTPDRSLSQSSLHELAGEGSSCEWLRGDFQNNAANSLPGYKIENHSNEGDQVSYQCCDEKLEATVLPIPLKLNYLRASEYGAPGLTVLTHRLPRNNSLKEIDFSSSFLRFWGQGFMPEGITHANLNDNFCTKINQDFFKPNNSLVHLTMNNNFLGPDFANDHNGAIFVHLKELVYLDISTNMVYEFPAKFFKGLVNLKRLILSNNKIQVLNCSFSHMTNLRYLDLSNNSITWVAVKTQQDLDQIASQHLLEIDLSNNPLPCTCAGIGVLNWMATTKARILSKDFLKCRRDDGEVENIGNLTDKVRSLQRSCVTRDILAVIFSAFAIVSAIFLGFAVLYRCRWKLRYLHNIAMAKLYGFQPNRTTDDDGCRFDAYFLYTKETEDFVLRTCIQELEVKRGHRICVEDRDFLAGTYMSSNILSAVQNSTKVVPVVAPTFYEGRYSEYGIKMAVEEEIYTKRSILHLLIYEHMEADEMSRDLLSVMSDNRYSELPPVDQADEDVMQNFWDQLSLSIGHSANSVNREQLPRLPL